MQFLSLFLAGLLVSAAAAAAAGVEDVASPRGATIRLLVEKGENPWVTVVLFAGGKGVLKIPESGRIKKLGGNFLVRARARFQRLGAVTAVIDSPSDRPRDLYFFRSTEKHAEDVAAVIGHLRAKYGLPVWLIGTSRGTNSVANAGVRLQGLGRPDGIVLTATMLESNSRGDHVLPMELEKIAVPVLIAHHRDDACSVTPPGNVDYLKRRLTAARPVKVLWYEGGDGVRGRECGARHYHGFQGIEDRVVADIMAWIKAPRP